MCKYCSPCWLITSPLNKNLPQLISQGAAERIAQALEDLRQQRVKLGIDVIILGNNDLSAFSGWPQNDPRYQDALIKVRNAALKYGKYYGNAGQQYLNGYAVSADPPELTRERFRQYGEFAFPVLSDPGNKVAGLYGVYRPASGEAPEDLQHGTFVIGRDGCVHWVNTGNSPFTASTFRSAKYRSPSLGGRTWPWIVSPVRNENFRICEGDT